jgi:hypothetical protein
VPAHAHSLKLGFEFLSLRDLTWDEIGGDTVAQFASWLRAAADNVIVFDERASRRSPATVNRQLAAHLSLDNYQARAVVAVAAELANRLGRLLDVKDETHHGVAIVSAAKVRSAIRAAAQLVARAAEDLERGGAQDSHSWLWITRLETLSPPSSREVRPGPLEATGATTTSSSAHPVATRTTVTFDARS